MGIGSRGAYLAAGLAGLRYTKRLGGSSGAAGTDSELSPAGVVVAGLVMLSIVAAAVAIVAFVIWAVLR